MEIKKIIKEMKDFSKNYANISEYIYSLDLDKVEILLGYINNLEQQLKKKDEVIEKAINKCCNTLDYINNTLLLNNIKVELTELLKIKGELDMILESFVEEVE